MTKAKTTKRAKNNSDTTGTVKCSRCGALMPALDFNVHECAGKRSLSDLPTDILRRLAYKQITETEAWHLADAQKK